MKKIFVLLLALLIAFALVGCNIAPNVPRVTPYGTNGTGNYNNGFGGTGAYGNNGRGPYTTPGGTAPYGNRTGTYKQGTVISPNMPPIRTGVNASDKYILPGAGAHP